MTEAEGKFSDDLTTLQKQRKEIQEKLEICTFENLGEIFKGLKTIQLQIEAMGDFSVASRELVSSDPRRVAALKRELKSVKDQTDKILVWLGELQNKPSSASVLKAENERLHKKMHDLERKACRASSNLGILGAWI